MRTLIFRMMTLVFATCCSASTLALEDMPESRDHPEIPRIEGSAIVGYSYQGYGEGDFMSGVEDRKIIHENTEGELTQLIYVGPENFGSLEILRNYQKAFEELGNVTEKFSCRKDCASNLGKVFVWAKTKQISSTMDNAGYKYGNNSFYIDQAYWYGTVQSADAEYTISLYSAVRTDRDLYKGGQYASGQALIHLDIVKSDEFKSSLTVVAPEEIIDGLAETGHIALYGIYFDFDAAALRPESTPALEAIEKALGNDTSVKIYVVGHTDNQGSLEYNLGLSKRRAASVVEALTTTYGISSERLVAGGVGQMAPVASNRTEEGQGLNRRVELVEF
jgi:OOP family OmpA-OmpF porin